MKSLFCHILIKFISRSFIKYFISGIEFNLYHDLSLALCYYSAYLLDYVLGANNCEISGDKYNHPKRVKLIKKHFKKFCFIQLILIILNIISLIFSSYNYYYKLYYLCIILLSHSYNLIKSFLGIYKTLFILIMNCIFIFSTPNFKWAMVNHFSLILILSSKLSKTIYSDIIDYEGDKKVNISTIPTFFGIVFASKIIRISDYIYYICIFIYLYNLYYNHDTFNYSNY